MDKEKLIEWVQRYKLLLVAGLIGFLLMTSIGMGAMYGSNKICANSGGIKVQNTEGVNVCVIAANVQRDYCVSMNENLNKPQVYYVPQFNITE